MSHRIDHPSQYAGFSLKERRGTIEEGDNEGTLLPVDRVSDCAFASQEPDHLFFFSSFLLIIHILLIIFLIFI